MSDSEIDLFDDETDVPSTPEHSSQLPIVADLLDNLPGRSVTQVIEGESILTDGKFVEPPIQQSISNSPDDFKKPLISNRKRARKNSDSDAETECCSICLDTWNTSGRHRVVSLKCGHLFGQNCIEKWLRGQGEACPQCNKKARILDIRHIYARKVTVLDTTERDRALELLEEERTKRRQVEKELALSRLHYQLLMDKYTSLNSEGNHGKEAQSRSNNESSFYSERPESIKVGHKGCRLLGLDTMHSLLLATHHQDSAIFNGYGIVKVDSNQFRTMESCVIHTKPIKSISVCSSRGLVLTGSLDRCVKVTNVLSNFNVVSYNLPVAPWSCVWNSDNDFYFYVGLQNGNLMTYDIRDTAKPLCEVNAAPCPLVSLAYVPNNHDNISGVLVGTLSGCQFWQRRSTTELLPHYLSLSGSCISVAMDSKSGHCLTTLRPGKLFPLTRHVVSQLSLCTSQQPSTVVAHPIHTFNGSSTMKFMSRSTIFTQPDGNIYVIAGDEAKRNISIWDISSGSTFQTLPVPESAILDVHAFQTQDRQVVCGLTDSAVHVYSSASCVS